MEPEFVKFDMALVRGLEELPMKRQIIRSIVRLCRDLEIDIIAEIPADRDARG